MRHRTFEPGVLIVISILIFALPVRAAWQNNGVKVSAGDRNELAPRIAPDTTGGAYIAWLQHFVSSMQHPSIFVQKIDTNGNLLWGGGRMLTPDSLYAWEPVDIAPDGAGGALVVWSDGRENATYSQDIYAQRLDASGNRLWAYWGAVVYAGTDVQNYPLIVSDGAGGAIIVWRDDAAGDYDLRAQRLDASGSRLWPLDGVLVCDDPADQLRHRIATDGAGGVIVVWDDDRVVSDQNVYAQRLDAGGTVQWGPAGIPICTEAGQQTFPQLVSDEAGGAIITWEESTRNGLYAQHVDAGGDTLWAADGLVIYSYYIGGRTDPQIAPDGSGGAVLCWNDGRTPRGIYAQRIDGAGGLLWNGDGVMICTAIASQYDPQIASDGKGGAAVAWQENRNISYLGDVYARTVDAYGNVQGPVTGTAICTDVENQMDIRITTDSAGGGIVSWRDNRDAATTWNDIYAGRVYFNGSTDADPAESPRAAFLSQNHPNPFNPSTTIPFYISERARVRIAIYDAAGRAVCLLVDGVFEKGRHEVVWNGRNSEGGAAATGVYFCRMSTGAIIQTKKTVLLR
jgi:hypothetical protein